jgi:hypothetical protein
MFAWIDYRPPTLLNGMSWLLLVALSFAALSVSPISPLGREARRSLVLVFPAGIFIFWFLFLQQLVWLNPHIHYYLGPRGVYSWIMNTGICSAFGIAFSIDVLRDSTGGRRIYGRWSLIAFIIVLLGIPVFMPVVMTT